ncbi:sugar phosphate nucleotidyltransferase [Halosegnis marinus]|uniref:Bifunctional protein GlmU n=1 Tax=Halosegnis marinus TaxID=3034023 RepID=A0ABD5ZPZ7_9EURY|nr:sugar phosphate nucleotidyltransferase [Halosegnis sp. DT85]
MTVTTGVVLAAGEGTRLRPLTRNRPKPMLPAANRPILEYVLDALLDAGVEELVVVVGYRRDRVQEHFGSTYRDAPVTYVRQEKQLGSGHALLQAREAVDGDFVAVNGDRVVDPDTVAATLDAFDGSEPVMAVRDHPNAAQYGAVRLDGDRVTDLVEKPTADEYRLINAGVYALTSDCFDRLVATPRRDGSLILTDALLPLVEEGSVRAVHTDGLWVDATYPWDLLEAARRLLDEGWVTETQRSPGVHVHRSATVHEDATLQGPVVVGPDAEIAASAVVGPDAALGRNVTVGANATVERSVVDADTRVCAASVIRDCVTGSGVVVGPGATVPGGPADVRVGDRVFPDERLGAVLADRAELGGGATCEPGTLVGVNARVGPGAFARDRVPEDGEVVR